MSDTTKVQIEKKPILVCLSIAGYPIMTQYIFYVFSTFASFRRGSQARSISHSFFPPTLHLDSMKW